MSLQPIVNATEVRVRCNCGCGELVVVSVYPRYVDGAHRQRAFQARRRAQKKR